MAKYIVIYIDKKTQNLFDKYIDKLYKTLVLY